MWQNIVTIITMLSSCVAVKINYILTALVIFPIGDIYVMISGIVYILRLQSIDRYESLLSRHMSCIAINNLLSDNNLLITY